MMNLSEQFNNYFILVQLVPDKIEKHSNYLTVFQRFGRSSSTQIAPASVHSVIFWLLHIIVDIQ